MAIVFVPFDGWSPSSSYFGEGWSSTLNLYPAYDTWRPWRHFVPFAPQVLGNPMNGAYVHTWNSGVGSATYLPDAQTVFSGTVANLHTIDPATGTFANVSRAAPPYTANSAGWRYASVGNDVWAANWLDLLQRRVNNAGLFTDGVVSTFSPKARFIATVREHLLSANLSNAGRFQDELAWSDADDATNFDPAAAGSTSTSLAAAKRLVSIPGQITGLLGGEYAIAFKRLGMYVLQYTGTVQVFQPDVLSPHVGTAYPSSIINSRYGIFFLGPDGFYSMAGLSAPQKFSPPGIDQILLDSDLMNSPPAAAWQEDIQVVGFQFTGWPLIGWSFRYKRTDPGNQVALLYNPVTQQWSQVQTSGLNASAPPATEFTTAMVERPYAPTLYESLAALTWDGTSAKYAPLGLPASVVAPTMRLNYRPANFDEALPLGQSQITGVLPMFSKTAVDGVALTPSITVEALLDPALGNWNTETRISTERDTVAGWYPFQTAGRLFRITVSGVAAEDFASFEGVFVDQKALQ